MRQTAIVKHVGPGGASIEIGGTIIHSALLANTVPAQDLHPGDLVSIQWVDGKPHVVAVLTWRGEYHAVPDEVAPQIVSYEEGGPGSTVHGELFGLEEDDHDQYVHVGLSRVITAQHTIAPDSEMAPLALGEFAQGQTVIGLRADQLNKSVLAGNGLTGGGLLTDDVGLALDTPGTIGVSSTNEASGNHTHAVDHASNVQDGATKLLSSNAGLLVLKKLGVSGTPADGYLAKIGGSMELEGNLVFTGATREIQTSAGDLYLAPAGKTQSSKDLTFTGYNRVSEAYVSGAFGAGYAIGHTAAAGSYLEVDNVTVRGSLRTHIFQYDVVRATNGYLYIADATEITHPAEGSYIFVKHPVFHTGDLLWYKDYDLSSSQLISQVKMTVAGENTQVVKNGQTVYRYTVTVNDGSLTDLDAGGTVVRVGGSAQDRQGAVYIDAASQFSPFLDVYAGVASWADFHSPSKVKSRLGRLDGITAGTNEYGLLAGSGIADTDKYLRLSNLVARINNIPVMVYKGGNAVIVLDPDAPYLGVGAVAPSTWLGAPGFWTGLHDGQYKTYVGDNDGSRLQWDGLDLSIYDKNNSPVLVSGQSGNWLSSLMISESLGQFLFSQSDGLLLLGPYSEQTASMWRSSRGQALGIAGAAQWQQGHWTGTRGLEIVPGTTNLVPNPVLGGTYSSGVAPGWTKGGAAEALVCTESDRFKLYGDKCQFLTFLVSGGGWPLFYCSPALANSTTYTWQAWLYVESLTTAVRVVASLGTGSTYTDLTTRGFHHVVMTAETAASGSDFSFQIATPDNTVAEVYVLGAQVEAKGYATPLAAGSFGSGFAWSGTAYNSATVRTGTASGLSVSGVMPSAQGTVAMWFKVHDLNADGSVLWCAGDANTEFDAWITAAGAIRFHTNTGVACSGGTVVPETWHRAVFTWDVAGSEQKLYLDGKIVDTGSDGVEPTRGVYLGVGYSVVLASTIYNLNGVVGEFATFGSVWDAEDVAADWALNRPLVDAGAVTSPGLYILDGRFTIASGTSGTRLVLNSTSLGIGNGITVGSGDGIWLGLEGDTPKAFIGKRTGNRLIWDGSTLSVTGTINITSGVGIANLVDAGALATVDDMDGVPEGTTYGKLRRTNLSAGNIKLTSNVVVDGKWYDESGVEIDANKGINIYGKENALTTRATKTGTIQCYVGADGAIYAGGGGIKMSSAANLLFSINSQSRGISWFSDTGFSTVSGYIGVAKTSGVMTIATGGPSWGTAPDMRFDLVSSAGGGSTWTAIYIDASDVKVRINGASGGSLSCRNNNDGAWPAFYAHQNYQVNRAVAHFDQDHESAPIIRLDGPWSAATEKSLGGYFKANINGTDRWVPYYV